MVERPVEQLVDDAAGRGSGEPDWPAKAADQVVDLVDQIRDKTTGPAITAARTLVFGLLAVILGVAAFVLLVVGLVRLINVYVPGGVWVAHLIVGLVFVVGGLFLWMKRHGGPAAE